MVKTFKSPEGLVGFIKKAYPHKNTAIKLVSTSFGFFLLKEGLSLTDALTQLLPFSPKSAWKEEEYIRHIAKRS